MQFPLQQRKIIRGSEAHIKAGLGAAVDYVANYVQLRAPRSGEITTYWGKEGGNWLSLKFDDGYVMKFAHLDKYVRKSGKCVQGELLAITGNTGSITTGPHLHLEVYTPDGKRMDPEKYFGMYTFKLTIVNPQDVEALKAAVVKYSRGMVQLEVKQLYRPVSAMTVLSNDATIAVFRELGIKESAMVYYECIGDEPYMYGVTYFDPVVNVPVIALDKRQDAFHGCFEVSHAIQKLYNATRPAGAPSVEILDIFTPDEAYLYKKFDVVTPYLHLLDAPTEEPMIEFKKGDKSNNIYAIDEKGVAHAFAEPTIYNIFAKYGKVITIPQAQMDAIPKGMNIALALVD